MELCFKGLRDSSGLRLVMTPDLRQYDAGLIAQGHRYEQKHTFSVLAHLIIINYMSQYKKYSNRSHTPNVLQKHTEF